MGQSWGAMLASAYVNEHPEGIAGPAPFWRMGAVCASGANEHAREHSFDFTTGLQEFDTPVLLLYSEYNRAYGKSHAEHVSSAYPRVQLAEIRGTGHDIVYFGWEILYPIAKAYLNTVR